MQRILKAYNGYKITSVFFKQKQTRGEISRGEDEPSVEIREESEQASLKEFVTKIATTLAKVGVAEQ